MAEIFIIGGPNGAGKTTTAINLLPDLLHCKEYVNADAIAAGLSPFNPEGMAVQAGRLMLERINSLASQEINFAFETTLASKTFVGFLKKNKTQNYQINLVFLWLQSPELAKARVKDRVDNGGHDIPIETIYRRYYRGMVNFLNLYIPLADNWALYDNSFNEPQIIAEKSNNDAVIYNENLWSTFNKVTNEHS